MALDVNFFYFVLSVLSVCLCILVWLLISHDIFGSIATKILNSYLKKSGSYISFGSLKFSLLRGNIVFKDFRFANNDYCVRSVDGIVHINWWTSKPKKDLEDSNPYRINAHLNGLEIQVYNSSSKLFSLEKEEDNLLDLTESVVPVEDFKMPFFNIFAPITKVHVHRGSIIVGNPLTNYISISSFHYMTFYYITEDALFPHLDYYRVRFKFEFAQFNSKISKNDDYYREKRGQSIDSISFISESFESMVTESENKSKKHKWHGLKRFQQLNIDIHKSRVISSPALTIDYYYDVCGPDTADTDEEPEFGINIHCEHSNINYGSFQNKQRLILSQIFFPYNPTSSKEENLRYRRPSICKIRFNANENNTLLIPFLSNKTQNTKILNTGDMSKYLQWITCTYHVAEIIFDLPLTENGKSLMSLNMTSQENSNIEFSLSNSEESFIKTERLIAYFETNNLKDEYIIELVLTFYNSEIMLLKEHIVHIKNMINDLIESNSLLEYEQYPLYMYKNQEHNLQKDIKQMNFKPSKYRYKIQLLNNFDIYLNVNERGMEYIENFEANSYYLITGDRLNSKIETEEKEFDLILKDIFFDIHGSNIKVFTIYPPYHTIFKFLESEEENFLEEVKSQSFLSTHDLFIDGKYTYYLNDFQCIHKPIDQLLLNIKGNNVDFLSFGYNLKSFFDFKDNYLSKEQNADIQESLSLDDNEKLEPEFHINISIEANEVNCRLPLNLYSCHTSALAKTSKVDFRIIITDDIDISIRSLPISLTLPENTSTLNMKPLFYTDQFYFNFYGNYSTYEPENVSKTSSCIKSKFIIDIGNVVTFFTPNQILLLLNGLNQLAYHFKDRDNTLIQNSEITEDYCHDLLRISINSINITLWTNRGAMDVNISNGIKIYYDTLINDKYGEFMQILVTSIKTRFFIQDQSSYVTEDSISIGEFALENWIEVGNVTIPAFYIKNIVQLNQNAIDRYNNQKLHIKNGSKSRKKLKEWYETTEFECDPWDRKLCKQFFYEGPKANDDVKKLKRIDEDNEKKSLPEGNDKSNKEHLDFSSDTIYLNCSQNDLPLAYLSDHYIYEEHYSKPHLSHFIMTKKSNFIVDYFFQSTLLFPDCTKPQTATNDNESRSTSEDCKETSNLIIHINDPLELSLTPESIVFISSLINSISSSKQSLESILDSIQFKLTSKLFHLPSDNTNSVQTILDIYASKIKILLRQKGYQENESTHSTALTINNVRCIYDMVKTPVFNNYYVPKKSKEPNCLYPFKNRFLMYIDKLSVLIFKYPDYYIRSINDFYDTKGLELNIILSVNLDSKSTVVSKMDTTNKIDIIQSQRYSDVDISTIYVNSKQKFMGSVAIMLDEWLYALNKLNYELKVISNYNLLSKLVISDSLLRLPENNINDDSIDFHVLGETSSVHRSIWRIIAHIRRRFKNSSNLRKMKYSCASIHNSNLLPLYKPENILSMLSCLESDEKLISILKDDPHKFYFIFFEDLEYHFNRSSTHIVKFKWNGLNIDLKVNEKTYLSSSLNSFNIFIAYDEQWTLKNEFNRAYSRRNENRLSSINNSYIDPKMLFQPNLPLTTSKTSVITSAENISIKIHKVLSKELFKCLKYFHSKERTLNFHRHIPTQSHLNSLNSTIRSLNINDVIKSQSNNKFMVHILFNNLKFDICMDNGNLSAYTKKPMTFSAYNTYGEPNSRLEYNVLFKLPLSNLYICTNLEKKKFKLLESSINDVGFNIRFYPTDKDLNIIDVFSKVGSINSILSAIEPQSSIKFVNELLSLKKLFSIEENNEKKSDGIKKVDIPTVNAIFFYNLVSVSIEQVPEYSISYIINSLFLSTRYDSHHNQLSTNSNVLSHHLSLEPMKEIEKKSVELSLPSFSSHIHLDTRNMVLDSTINLNYVHNTINLVSFKHLYIFQSILINEIKYIISIVNQNLVISSESKDVEKDNPPSILLKFINRFNFKGTELSIISPSASLIIYTGSFNTNISSPTDQNERTQFKIDLDNFCFIFTSPNEKSHIYNIDENIVKSDNIDVWAGLTTCISIQSYPDKQFKLIKNQQDDLTSLWIRINNTYALLKPWIVERLLHVWLYVSEYYRNIQQERDQIMKNKNIVVPSNVEKHDDNIASFIEKKNIVSSIMINNFGLCIPTQTLENKYTNKAKFYDIEPRISVIITLDYFYISTRKKFIDETKKLVAYAKFDNFFIGYKPVHSRLYLHNQTIYQRMNINFLNIKTGDIKLCLHYKSRSTICDLNIHSSGLEICLNANTFNYFFLFKRDILLNSNKIYKIIEDMNKQSYPSQQTKQPIENNKFVLNIRIITDSGSIQFYTCSTHVIKGLNYKEKKENKMQIKIEDILSSSTKMTSGHSDSYLTVDSNGTKKKLSFLFNVPLPSCNIHYHKIFDKSDKKSKAEDINTLYILIDGIKCNISPDFVIFYHELSANMQMMDKIFKNEILDDSKSNEIIEKEQSNPKKIQETIENPTLSTWNVLLNIRPSILKLTCEPYSETVCIVKTDDFKVLYHSEHCENLKAFQRSVLIELKSIILESHNPHHDKNNLSFEVDMLRFHFNYSIKDLNNNFPVSNPITIFIRLRSTSSYISLPYLSEIFIFQKVWTEGIYSYHFQSEFNDQEINKKMGVLDVLLQDKFILVDFELGSICAKVDLGPSISVVSASTKGTKVKFSSFGSRKHDELGEEFILNALLEEVVALFEGPLYGNLKFSGLEISSERRINEEKTGINRLNATIKPIYFYLSYNLSPVLLLISKDMGIVAQDSFFTNDQSRKMTGADIDIVTKSIYLQISSESISTPPKIVQRILQNIKKSKLKADVHVNSIEKLLKLRSEINKLRQKVEDPSTKYKHSIQQKKIIENNRPLYVAGKVKISGQDLNIRLFGYNLNDPSWMQLHINSFRLNLIQKINDDLDIKENKIIYRELSMILGDTHLSKFIEDIESRKRRNMEKWERKAKVENIFKLPTTTTILHSVHNLNSKVIDVYYVSKFKSSISVSVVLGLYNDLKDIVNVYIKVVENNLFDWISSKTQEVTEESEEKERTFICKKFEFNPSINVLGDFTPNISTVFGWLGIKKAEETIPKYTHKITDSLEEILIYVEQLSHKITKSRQKQLQK